MKTIIATLLIVLSSVSMSAATPADTIAVNNAKITRVIEHKTVNSKGNPTVKYFFIYNGELIATSKTVVEKYKLCKQYNARLAMAMVVRKTSKRIILN